MYWTVVNAHGRLAWAAGGGRISIEAMCHYHAAFAPPVRLPWFIDAIQHVEMIFCEQLKQMPTVGEADASA